MDFILTGIVFLPLIAAIIIMMMKVNGDKNGIVIGIASGASILTFVAAVVLLVKFDSHYHGMQFVQSVEWVSMLNIYYKVGVDGISLWLVVLTALLGVLAVYFSRDQKKNLQYFLALILLMEGGILGVFVAMDSILFYVFWELMLVPGYFLIGFWGEGNKIYATTKFVIYTLVGSLLMLVGLIWVSVIHYDLTQTLTFDIPTLLQTQMPADVQFYMFVCFFMAFAIKIPIFPFPSWLPHAYVACPIPALILITGAMSKAGAYGLIR
ncbi:MAG: NADH-quinone oxidoreductase subunit M, partial [Nitrospinaceae bacterium]